MADYQIDKMRKELGLSKISKGYRECLKCEKKFYYQDKKKNKMCEGCLKYANEVISESSISIR